MIGLNRATFGGSRGYGIPPTLSGSFAPYILGQSAVAVSGAGDTNENALATITVPANALGLNGTLKIWTQWTYTNSANAKTLRVRFSTISGTAFLSASTTTTATAQELTMISNRNAANSQVGGQAGVTWPAASTNAVVTAAVDTTVATTIVITGQKVLGSETLTLERYICELLYGA